MYCRVRFDMMVPPSQPLRQSVPAVLCSPGRMENSSLYLLCLISAWYWQKVQKAVRKIVQKWSRFRPQPEPDAPDRFNMVFASRVPQPNSYAGQQLLRVEGLREIIRRAAQQQSDLVLHRRFGADYNDGNALKLRRDLLAGQPRQYEVEQNEIGAAVFQQKQRLRAGIGAEHRVACPLQNLLLQTPDGCVVVNNQNCLHCFQLSCFYFRSCPSPPIKAVISSMRSSGNGGWHSGFMAMDMSFMGLSSAATRLELSAPQRRQR